jgi:hypothetical protein
MRAHPLPPALTALALALLVATPALPARAARMTDHKTAHTGPRAIGRFEDWTAAVHQEAGQPVCYAFTRATASTPALRGRGDVVLTVTERPGGRDAVAISAGFAYAPNAAVQVAADATSMEFYTAQRSAFARDGHAAVIAFQRGRQVVARSPGPKNGVVTDSFSLRGFSAAYAAILKACPAKG